MRTTPQERAVSAAMDATILKLRTEDDQQTTDTASAEIGEAP